MINISTHTHAHTSKMELTHVSHWKTDIFQNITQEAHGKPQGLWWSYPEDWIKFAQPSYKWIAHTTVTYKSNFIFIDMSKEVSLNSFIALYKLNGLDNEIDWPKVQINYSGIFFQNVDKMPKHYWQKYNKSDGCWILSIDVDSLCVWKPSALGEIVWKRKNK